MDFGQIRRSSDDQALFVSCGLFGDTPLSGDYTGDGVSDLVAWRPGTSTWYICQGSTGYDEATTLAVQFGRPGDVPVQGDFDGDGVFDVAVWRPTTGDFFFRGSASGVTLQQQSGLTGDTPMP